LHGRKPYKSASFDDLKKVQFSFLGLRAEHVGLQKMPVVLTPTKNNPSKELSLLSSASYKTSGDGNEAAIIAIQISARVDTIQN